MHWEQVVDLPVIHGPLYALLTVAALAGVAGLLLLRRDRTWFTRKVPLAAVASAAVLAIVWVALEIAQPWPDALPPVVLLWSWAALLALALLVVGWGGRRRRTRLLAAGAAVMTVLGAADNIDAVYGAYPTVATVLQLPPPGQVAPGRVLGREPGDAEDAATAPTIEPPGPVPDHGSLIEVNPPPTRSGFAARSAWIYVPPSYRVPGHPRPPVLLLAGGHPGGPRDWLDGGHLVQHMDTWAKSHGGRTPVVVMPDVLGSEVSNPMCMDSALGNVDTYLTQDLLGWVSQNLEVATDHRRWAVGGFSSGGTCALQLAVAHPDLFPTFIDVAGQQGPTLGSREKTVAATFRGDTAAFDRVDPLPQLAARRYPASAGYLVAGAQDPAYLPQAKAVAAATAAAGMDITYRQVPGGHSWQMCSDVFAQALPWLMPRMGLLP